MTQRKRPLTPDFLSHDWLPLVAATIEDDFVKVRWEDGLEFRAYILWLWESSEGVGFDPLVREGLTEPGDLPAPASLRSAACGTDGALELTWSAHQSRIHPGWLRYVAEGRLSVGHAMPPRKAWTAVDENVPPTLNGQTILDDEAGQESWLDHLVRFGICRLTNTPANRDFLERLMTTVGAIRGSNFGNIFTVEASASPDSTANTNQHLGQHTDLPTRETPPGYQFLHCIENTVAGGASRMTDGLAVVDALRRESPDDYRMLTTARWLFMNRAPDAEHRWEGSIIELADGGRPLTIRAFYPVRSLPLMPEADIPAAYNAMRTFSRYVHDPRFQVSYRFQPGDLVGFDNRRVLHGRDAYEGSGERLLTGCYMDHDEIFSRLRVLRRAGWSG